MQFLLRPWAITDLDNLVRHANNPSIAQNMMDRFPHPYTKEAGENFINMATAYSPAHLLCIDIDGTAVGGIGLHIGEDIYRKNAELGYWLAETFWGNGIVTEAVRQMVDYGFRHFDINRIYARPFGTNSASKKVLEKAGFQLEGSFEKTFYKNDTYFDEFVYAIRR